LAKRRKLDPSARTTLHRFFGSQSTQENKKADQGDGKLSHGSSEAGVKHTE